MKVQKRRFQEMLHLLSYTRSGVVKQGEELKADFESMDFSRPLSYVESTKALKLLEVFEPYVKARKKGYLAAVNHFLKVNMEFIREIDESYITAYMLKETKEICINNKLGIIPETPSDHKKVKPESAITKYKPESSAKKSKVGVKKVEMTKEAIAFVVDCEGLDLFDKEVKEEKKIPKAESKKIKKSEAVSKLEKPTKDKSSVSPRDKTSGAKQSEVKPPLEAKLSEAKPPLEAKLSEAKTPLEVKPSLEVKPPKEEKALSDMKIDLLMSYDTTGSMSQVLSNVRREAMKFVKDMQGIGVDVRIGIIAHGDYCDKDNPYTIRAIDFTKDVDKLVNFIHDTKSTFGGDADECYELVLKTARTDFSWERDRTKIFVMIGDSNPHSVGYRWNDYVNKIDWVKEVIALGELGVKIYSVHAMPEYRRSSYNFYRSLADKTGGKYLTLGQFHEIIDIIKLSYLGIIGEDKVNEFVTILRDGGRMSRNMAHNVSVVTGRQVDVQTARSIQASGIVPVPEGRFQVIEVHEDCSIREFVQRHGIVFRKGRAFYELTKAETVQQYKEVILEDKVSKDLYTGADARTYLGLPPQIESGGSKDRVHASKTHGEYGVFVQSTSVNRKLIAGTRLLYELEDI